MFSSRKALKGLFEQKNGSSHVSSTKYMFHVFVVFWSLKIFLISRSVGVFLFKGVFDLCLIETTHGFLMRCLLFERSKHRLSLLFF